ncbi:MAG: hypothetical protein ACE5QV_02075, partial [Fidelibacterota bacterium]
MKLISYLNYIPVTLFILFHIAAGDLPAANETVYFTRLSKPDSSVYSLFNLQNRYRKVIDLSGSRWNYRLEGDSIWKRISVPHSLPISAKLRFKSYFVPDSSFSGRVFKLLLFGINYHSRIYVNGVALGEHHGGGSTFSLLIPSNLIKINQKNLLEIEVDNFLDWRSTIPLKREIWGWKNYGGILRDIFIAGLPPRWIDGVKLDYSFFNEYSDIHLNLKITTGKGDISPGYSDKSRNSKLKKDKFTLQYAIFDLESKELKYWTRELPVNFEEKDEIVLSDTLKDIELWSPADPRLYSLVIYLKRNGVTIDSYQITTGFREIKVQKSEIYLNGSRMKIRGILKYEDYKYEGASAGYNSMESDVKKIRRAGFNTVYFPVP